MKNIKNIIFDFGGVLYKIDFGRTREALKALSGSPELFKNYESKHFADFPVLYEKGEISSEEFLEQMRQEFNLKATNNQIKDAWNALLIKPFDDAVEVLRKLSKDYNLYLLSNTNEIHFNHFYPESKELFDIFQKSFLSYKIGLRKPDKDIFEFVMKNLKIDPNETLFIDDSIDNINAASQSGLKTNHFVNQKLSDLFHTV